jgi:hypothetical protein
LQKNGTEPVDGTVTSILTWAPGGRSRSTTRSRGFNVRLWRAHGLAYALVSDLDAAELGQLAARLGG